MASPLDTFALTLGPHSVNRALARRLMDQTLTPPEQDYLAKVERIVTLEQDGLIGAKLAAELGWKTAEYELFIRTEKYRLVRTFVMHRAQMVEDGTLVDRRRVERAEWDDNGRNTLDYFAYAFRRHVKADPAKDVQVGDFKNPDRAERAANAFARSAGWLEPVPTKEKPKELKAGVIQQAMAAVRASDRRETVVRVTETTTIEVGSRETAAMGE